MSVSDFSIVQLMETSSTNDEVKKRLPKSHAKYLVVTTLFQTAGRGQTGNHWESERGRNLLFSIGLRPSFLPPRKQFLLLQISSLAVCRALNEYAPGFTIKWPNDIYYGERKICGTLIENELRGSTFSHCVLGTGINVNQTAFSNYPPNAVSLKQIVGRDTNCGQLLERILCHFDTLYQQLEQGDNLIIASAYRKFLFRGEGMFPYSDSGGTFNARIDKIEADGHLILCTEAGESRRYHFKEVKYLFGQRESN